MNRPASEVDPEGAKAADANRTSECGHPLCAGLLHLACRSCGVFISEGKVLDVGGHFIEGSTGDNRLRELLRNVTKGTPK
jgi:hypothetical protein